MPSENYEDARRFTPALALQIQVGISANREFLAAMCTSISDASLANWVQVYTEPIPKHVHCYFHFHRPFPLLGATGGLTLNALPQSLARCV